jgi:hypothetical protein
MFDLGVGGVGGRGLPGGSLLSPSFEGGLVGVPGALFPPFPGGMFWDELGKLYSVNCKWVVLGDKIMVFI